MRNFSVFLKASRLSCLLLWNLANNDNFTNVTSSFFAASFPSFRLHNKGDDVVVRTIARLSSKNHYEQRQFWAIDITMQGDARNIFHY